MKKELIHLALIPDGNGRWAAAQNKPREYGHWVGYKTLVNISLYCVRLKIPFLTVYTLSYDNITKRNQNEISNVYEVIKRLCNVDLDLFQKYSCAFNPIGDFTCLKDIETVKLIENLKNKTKNNTGTVINLAIGYSGTHDIAQSIRKLYTSLNNTLPANLQEMMAGINNFSYLNNSPPVDLCIRLGGEQRISNFCLWQLAYAEFEFLNTLWPDFNEKMLDQCIADYYKRDRRFGTETESTLIKPKPETDNEGGVK